MKHSLILAIVLLPLLASGCNTMSGAGEDLSKGGQKLHEEAEENKNY